MGQWAQMLRSSFAKGDAERDRGLTTPDNIIRYDDIRYGSSADIQKLDLYRRREDAGSLLPVIVSVHGGGWVYGSKEVYQFYCMDLAERGFAVVNFSYRLAPEAQHPAPLEDTNLVFSWILEHAAEYGLDTQQIVAVGDSAGAHILSMYLAVMANSDYAAQYAFPIPEGLKIRAAALNCGEYLVDYDDPSIEDMMRGLMADYLPEGGTAQERERISPVNYITAEYPPVFLMSSAADFLKGQAPGMAAALTRNNVPFCYRFYGSSSNLLPHVFHLDIRSEDARLCNDEECAFFREILEKESSSGANGVPYPE